MSLAKCNNCGWQGNEDELKASEQSISFVHCPNCGSDETLVSEGDTPITLLNEIHVCFERMKAEDDMDMDEFVTEMEGLIQFRVIQGWITPLYAVQEAQNAE